MIFSLEIQLWFPSVESASIEFNQQICYDTTSKRKGRCFMAYILNERIAALRKERGLTQEQLGQMVGVSAQAVSKWEKGSMPDAELLPTIACQLEVSLDGLFGLEGGERADMTDLLYRWVIAIPEDRRMDQICRLVWRILDVLQARRIEDIPLGMKYDYLGRCDNETPEGPRWLRRSRIIREQGLALGIRADDMSFLSIWPEPEQGWEPFLSSNALYRRFFAALARPHCLELLEYLHARPSYCMDGTRYTPGVAAQAMGLDIAEVEALMRELAELTLLRSITVETETGPIEAYNLNEDEALVPLLYFARWALTSGGGAFNAIDRKSPILRGEKWKEKEN